MCSGGDESWQYGVMDWLQENMKTSSRATTSIRSALQHADARIPQSGLQQSSLQSAVQWTVPVPCWTRWEQQQVCRLLYVSQPCNFNTELTTPPLLTYAISIPELKTVTQDLQLADDKKVMNEQSVGRFLLRDKSIDCEAE